MLHNNFYFLGCQQNVFKYVLCLQRFHGKNENTPAPGAYNDPRTALDGLNKITGLKRSPFGQTSVRFTGDRKPVPGESFVVLAITTLIRSLLY